MENNLLQKRSKDLLQMVNHIPDWLCLFDHEGKWIQANQAMLTFLQLENQSYKEKTFSELFLVPHVNHDCLSVLKDLFDQKDSEGKMKEHALFSQPYPRILNIKFLPIHSMDNDQEPVKEWLMIGYDLTENETSWQTSQTLEALISNSPLAIISFDHDGIVKTWNPAAEQIFGWKPCEVIGCHIPLISEDEQDEFGDLLAIMLQGKALTDVEFCCKKKNGDLIDISLSITLLLDKQGDISGGMTVITDISKRKQAEEIIKHMAYHDTLTGLPNRNLFYDRLIQALKQAKRNHSMFAVLFLDLDRFKVINDSLGHTFGDLLLHSVGERLQKCIREIDTIARQGGDEFTALLIDIDHEGVTLVANRILDSLSQPFILQDQEITITPSIGISLYPSDGEDVETLIKHADTAMYRAKEQGRNNFQLYIQGMSTQLSNRLEMENSLRKALTRNEFILYYQPQFQIDTGEMVGMEALIRWNHPTQGFIPPSEFIPLAEETGLIIPIGEWVLQTACQQNKSWQQAGFPPVRVSVNISAQQFKQPQLVEIVERILGETKLNPQYLELEITENISMSDVHLTTTTLDRLKKLGIKISIDDFGTGYSSLGYLKRFPIDTIKIDQSFVRDIHADADDAAIVRAIMAMAHSLELNVIAEGVETMEQLNFLEQQNCDEAQGYLFMKPLSVNDLEKKWVESTSSF